MDVHRTAAACHAVRLIVVVGRKLCHTNARRNREKSHRALCATAHADIHNRVGLVLSAPLPGDIVRVIDVGDTPTPIGDPVNPVRVDAPSPLPLYLLVRAAKESANASAVLTECASPPNPHINLRQARALAVVVPGVDVLRVSPPSSGASPRGGAPLPVAAARWSTDAAVIAAARAYMAARKGQVQVDPVAVGVWEFTMPGASAAGVAVGDAVQFDRRASAGAVVARNRFHDSYDSCFRLQSAGTVLAGNVYARVPGGISVVYDDPWLEGSTDIANVLIEDNVFQDVLWPYATDFAQILHADPGVANVTCRNNTVTTGTAAEARR